MSFDPLWCGEGEFQCFSDEWLWINVFIDEHCWFAVFFMIEKSMVHKVALVRLPNHSSKLPNTSSGEKTSASTFLKSFTLNVMTFSGPICFA